MLEIPGSSSEHCLLTLQLANLPTIIREEKPGSPHDCCQVVQAKRLPDHRRRYLNYEGPIEGARGQVQRETKGRYEAITGSQLAVSGSGSLGEPTSSGSSQPPVLQLALTSDSLVANVGFRLYAPGASLCVAVSRWEKC
jgi:hypothetical protein